MEISFSRFTTTGRCRHPTQPSRSQTRVRAGSGSSTSVRKSPATQTSSERKLDLGKASDFGCLPDKLGRGQGRTPHETLVPGDFLPTARVCLPRPAPLILILTFFR